ncbi:glutamate--cysteine ligase [Kitasatospora sp. MBT63]|uniref:carboxylate-amine ligase n=1 Tax=Kitasatospora sp. MBT63 TaxID=1444768 RepID=UPI00053A4787|nr:glutamate--cysteine ligase [Kitasatospora sp. MBT63]
MLTLGVEEEYLLLDPVAGTPVARASQVRRAADLQPAMDRGEVQRELLQAQLEIATPVCRDLDEVGGHLLRMRHALGRAAARDGCLLAACAGAPFTDRLPVPVTDTARYQVMHSDAPRLTDEQLITGMHVHLGIPDRATGVLLLNGLRTWLPLLVALAANSPLAQGTDTGFASWRTLVFSRWPVSGPPPLFEGVADYDRRTLALVEDRLIRDSGQIYWHIRLSERFPTVELRAMDVQLRADEAVMLAGIVRALAARLLADAAAGNPAPAVRPEVLDAAVWHGARYGCAGEVFDPLHGGLRAAGDAAAALLEFIASAAGGDSRHIAPVLDRVLREGNGAARQRRELRQGGRAGLIRMIGDQTTGV